MQNLSVHIMHPQRGFARTAFRHDSCLQKARLQTHKHAAASRFSLCLCLPLKDNLTSRLPSGSARPRGAVSPLKIIIIILGSHPPPPPLHLPMYPNAII